MSLSDSYDKLRELVTEAEDDVKKTVGGNKAAGTRVRKRLQEIKNQAHAMRAEVLEARTDE
jgi:hypothetical protein